MPPSTGPEEGDIDRTWTLIEYWKRAPVVKSIELVDTSNVTVPSLARGGTWQRASEKLNIVILPFELPTLHDGVSAAENPDPMIVVRVPPANGPIDGESLCILGDRTYSKETRLRV